MAKRLLTLAACAALVAIASPALAEKPDNVAIARPQILPPCEIWASVKAPNFDELVKHEMAHCWGWWHPVKGSPLLAKTKAEREAYRAYVPPFRYRILGEYPNAIVHSVSERDAARECNSWGCAEGGLQ